ncbi:hypothetical protein [Micromonospora costi]|uniref:Uncharacterized protein n=1 Tax=Micromonospora costi TaxID=1530042 RepID=A0A3B0ADL2_9ACTN|nr:hypothetical protein [Micromonospora costi]RKN58469.1 hypothetical protein D7193_07955 [Micromonospora costi]
MAAEVRRLRAVDGLSVREIRARTGLGRNRVYAARARQHAEAARAVGPLNDRDLLLLGAAVYWREGAKSKPWRRDDHVQFINSDPGLLAPFLSFLETCGVDRSVPTYRVSIHETADAAAATSWWAQRLALPPDRFRRPTLKRHNPVTVRRNTGADYRGCLVINVPRSRELYWRIEGMIAELFQKVGGAGPGVGP